MVKTRKAHGVRIGTNDLIINSPLALQANGGYNIKAQTNLAQNIFLKSRNNNSLVWLENLEEAGVFSRKEVVEVSRLIRDSSKIKNKILES